MKTCQLYLMQALSKRGIPCDLQGTFLLRCGADETDWQELVTTGMIGTGQGRFVLTAKGRRTFLATKKSRKDF